MNMKNIKSSQLVVGIISWGSAIPENAVTTKIVAESQGRSDNPGDSLGIIQKTMPQPDVDTATLAVESASDSLGKLTDMSIKQSVGSLLIGSESHPYAVKPTGTIVAQSLGLSPFLSMADLQFACKAGTQALQLSLAQVKSGQINVGLAIGSDTAQSKPGDILEYAAGSGSGSFLVGRSCDYPLVAELYATMSIASDTPDFWRRGHAPYPEHAGRFSAEPAYFYHIITLTKKLLESQDLTPKDIAYVVFHTPNAKFPNQVAKILGFTPAQLEFSLPVTHIGNAYAAAVPLALANVLDNAESGKKILVVSYGSGAGADGFIFKTTKHLLTLQKKSLNTLKNQIDSLSQLNLVSYLQLSRSRNH
jgi:hydroxymethylglutaryl-CoA synthase